MDDYYYLINEDMDFEAELRERQEIDKAITEFFEVDHSSYLKSLRFDEDGFRLPDIESEEYTEISDEPIGNSCKSEAEASYSKRDANESREIPIRGTTSENSNAPPLSPDCYWSDEKIDDGEFEELPILSADQVIRLGEVMIIMLCQGPVYRVEEIVAALAYNVRDPRDVNNRLFTAAKLDEISQEGNESITVGSGINSSTAQNESGGIDASANGSTLESIGATTTEGLQCIGASTTGSTPEVIDISANGSALENLSASASKSEPQSNSASATERILKGISTLTTENTLEGISASATESTLEDIGESATQTKMQGIGTSTTLCSTETIQELEKLTDRYKYPRKEDLKDVPTPVKCIVKKKRNAKSYNCRVAIREFLQVTFRLDDESRAAFYCFIAAFLMRSGVKNLPVMAKHWSKAMDMFFVFYPGCFYSPTAPKLSRRAFLTLNKAFRPGTKLMKTVMRAFLKKMFEPGLPLNVKNCLNYVLLSHTYYYGMELVTLARTSLRILGDQRVCILKRFDSDENRPGINAMYQYYALYCEGCPLVSCCKYLPWCRILDTKYWSNLSPKAHPFLAASLMHIQYDERIWNMKSFKPTEECKAKGKEMAEKVRREQLKLSMNNLRVQVTFSKPNHLKTINQ